MWSAISRLFSKTNSSLKDSEAVDDTITMDRSEDRRRTTAVEGESQDTYDSRQAKQRASVKWLLSKAYNNRVPPNLQEPFYRDHEDQEHLKPQVVHALASAELYCLALANIYSDPNCHQLNHHGVLQALARKGALPSEPPDARLTETVLIQTTPLRLNAHMAVMEALMALYAKEVVTPDRVLVAVQRLGGGVARGSGGGGDVALPADHEQGLLLWLNSAAAALHRRARQELDAAAADGVDAKEAGDTIVPPALDIAPVREWKSLSDGAALAALVSFYCPEEVPWRRVVVRRQPSIQDSMHNLQLVYNFCARCLPASVFHMAPEDVTYMQGSMKQNLVVFLADLFNVLEIHPVKCVRFPGTDRSLWKEVLPRNSQGVAHKRSLPQSISAIPDLRSGLDQPAAVAGAFTVSKSAPTIQTTMPLKKSHSLQPADIHGKGSSLQDDRRSAAAGAPNTGVGVGGSEEFVVHRGRGILTLSAMAASLPPPSPPSSSSTAAASTGSQEEPLLPARMRPPKERLNADSKAEERGEPAPAGRPSNWEENRRASYAGRRSRRNSVSDDSQLTLENFGGSQENLHLLGRNPDKEPAVHVGRKISAPESPAPSAAQPVRSSAQDARSHGVEMLFSHDNGYYSGEKRDEEKPTATSASHFAPRDDQPPAPTSFAELSRAKADSNKERDEESPKSSFLTKKTNGTGPGPNGEKKTTFAALPHNTTTWQQQSNQLQQQEQQHSGNSTDEAGSGQVMASQLHNIRMKLEEKRRRIESEKRRMEVVMSKQRQKVGKAAFLQAVTKGKGAKVESEGKGAEGVREADVTGGAQDAPRPQRPLSLQEISEDVSSVEHKWLEGNALPYIEERRTPDIENMDIDQYQQSLAQMNSSLHEIQADIQRLASQQHQIQGLQPAPSPAPVPINMNMPMGYNPGSPPVAPTYTPPPPQAQFYLHEQQAHRRTWAQPEPFAPAQDGGMWGGDRLQKTQPASYNCQPSGFLLHDPHSSGYGHPVTHAGNGDVRFHNGDQPMMYRQLSHPQPQHHSLGINHFGYPPSTSPSSAGGYQSFQLHGGSAELSRTPVPGASPFAGTPPSASPVHRPAPTHQPPSQHQTVMHHQSPHQQSLHQPSVQQRISQMLGQEVEEKTRVGGVGGAGVIHAPVPTPPVDDMEPQSISFIGTFSPAEEGLSQSLRGLQISSGSRTYRIPSPTRPGLSRSALHHHQQQQHHHQLQHQLQQPLGVADTVVEAQSENSMPEGEAGSSEKGFYISFDGDSQPKRPKPPLRTKRSSPKKERPASQHVGLYLSEREEPLGSEPSAIVTEETRKPEVSVPVSLSPAHAASLDQAKAQAASGVGLVIGTELLNPDPSVVDEMERRKERIMLLSLQRRQQQEEERLRKEAEAQRRREMQKLREEERQRKKEEERLRRAAILEQYKLKKAIEEAEREGKLLPEKPEPVAAKPVPKLRTKSSSARPRPKTIHVDSGSVQELHEGGLSPSRSKKGSSSNLTDSVYSAPMRRDYYRGSQDSLADRLDERRGHSASLFKDSPDDGRGASPCRSVNQLGRRGSYKTSRDTSEPRQTRGRQKYPTYQGNFRGRKSNSLMNLCGSSTDQDSMVYRYADTDSGLGRATPPRRAPSPGMSSMRHLPSPSGPGSLPPGLMTKRRMFDDGSSDISSTPSSMMEYTGPRLYKQPATKSNRGIMLNAVEYCVFPGAVNKEAKRRVLEEIARSESKHFLILFRDAGCQFRALYAYCPEREDVVKLYGTGPKQITDRMFDKFFKYNSGGKCFSQIHTKHLTVTIDAFTIHNSLWQGKKVALPNKKDMPLVI